MRLNKKSTVVILGILAGTVILCAFLFRNQAAGWYAKRAESMISRGDRVQAERVLRSALSIAPQNTGILLQLTEIYLFDARYEDALLLLAKAQKVSPGDPEVYYLRGRVLFEKKIYDEAADSMKEALRLQPGFHRARIEAVKVLYRLNRIDEALVILREAPQGSDRDPSIDLYLYLLLEEKGEKKESRKELERIMQLPEPPREILTVLLSLYSEEVDESLLDSYVDTFLSAYSGDFEVFERTAGFYRERRRFSRAERILKDSADRFASLSPYHAELSRIFLGQGKFSESAKSAKRALSIDGSSVEAYNVLAKAQLGLRDYSSAAVSAGRSLELREKQPVILNFLAWVYLTAPVGSREYRPREALELARKAVALEPDNSSYLDTLARAYYACGRYDEALLYYYENRKSDSEISYAYYGLAVTYFRKGDRERGRDYLKKAREKGFFDRDLIGHDGDIPEVREYGDIKLK